MKFADSVILTWLTPSSLFKEDCYIGRVGDLLASSVFAVTVPFEAIEVGNIPRYTFLLRICAKFCFLSKSCSL